MRRLRGILCAGWLAGATLGAPTPLSAAPADPAIDRAQALFRDGQRRFEARDFAGALAAFTEGFERAPRPEFLLNIAQCHRELGHPAAAAATLRRFLAAAPRHPLRAAAERALRDVERELGEAPPAPAPPRPPSAPVSAPPASAASPPVAGPARAGVPPTLAAPAPSVAPSPLVEHGPGPAAAPAPRSRRWLWLGLGAVVLAGGATAVVLATRGGDDLQTIRLPPP